jgi:hypothetical protein
MTFKSIRVSELSGDALDWAVAKCEGKKPIPEQMYRVPQYSTLWEHGGPIIEREGISLRPIVKEGHSLHGQCLAAIDHGNTGGMVQWVKRETWHSHYWQGPTPLIAAMRCYVASKLGESVEVPEELV